MKRIIGREFYTLEEYIAAKGGDAFPAVMAEIAMTVPGSDPPVIYSSVDAVKNRYADRLLFASGTDWDFFYGHLADIANNVAAEFTSKKAAIDTLNSSLLANERKSTVEAKRADLGAVNFSSAYSDGGTITKSDAGNANIDTIVRYQRDIKNLFDAAVDAFEPFFLAIDTSSFDDDVPQEEFAGDFDQLDNRPRYNGQLMDHSTNIPLVLPQQQADFSETNTQSPAYIKNKPEIPVVPEDFVTSVNGESGDVTLTAAKIQVSNAQSVQVNLERIDENADALGGRVDNLETSVGDIEDDVDTLEGSVASLDSRLDAVETGLQLKSSVSGAASGGAWTELTIDGVTNDIPQGGGGGGTQWYHHHFRVHDEEQAYIDVDTISTSDVEVINLENLEDHLASPTTVVVSATLSFTATQSYVVLDTVKPVLRGFLFAFGRPMWDESTELYTFDSWVWFGNDHVTNSSVEEI